MGLAVVGAILWGMATPAGAAEAEKLYASFGDTTRAPIGWVEFCSDNPKECRDGATQPRDIVLTPDAWRDLLKVNRWVNETVKPMTDKDHWGVVEKWSLPTDGHGDCEDYVLLKRKMLIDAGWPREALLVTVVRDKQGDGHAVLTVKTDKGEFILDNQNEDVLAWMRDRLPFHETAIAKRPRCLGCAGRQTSGGRDGQFSINNKHETRDPVIPLPVPDRLARGQPSPKRLAAPFFRKASAHVIRPRTDQCATA